MSVEIGRAPQSAEHPDHALAGDLARSFRANLPWLERVLFVAPLARARRIDDGSEGAALAATVGSEAFWLALGRIARDYDWGQVED